MEQLTVRNIPIIGNVPFPTQKVLFKRFPFPNEWRPNKKSKLHGAPNPNDCLICDLIIWVMTLLQLQARAQSRYWTGSMRIFSARIGLPSTLSSALPHWKSGMSAKVTPAFTGKCCFICVSSLVKLHILNYIHQHSSDLRSQYHILVSSKFKVNFITRICF